MLQPTNDNDGYSTQQKYSKLNIRTNLDITVSPTTSVQLNFMGNFTEHNRPGTVTDDILQRCIRFLQELSPLKRKGEYGEVLRTIPIIRSLWFQPKVMLVRKLVLCLQI